MFPTIDLIYFFRLIFNAIHIASCCSFASLRCSFVAMHSLSFFSSYICLFSSVPLVLFLLIRQILPNEIFPHGACIKKKKFRNMKKKKKGRRRRRVGEILNTHINFWYNFRSRAIISSKIFFCLFVIFPLAPFVIFCL